MGYAKRRCLLKFMIYNLVYELMHSLVRCQPGRFDILLQNAGIASMHTAVTHHNTVVFLDRTNIGSSQINLTNGMCRNNLADRVSTHDCSAHSVVFDIASNTVRPLFVFTDTWCSSGAFLPNGTLMQTGGDFDGMKKVRYFSPCPSSDTCNWIESGKELLAGRWYATNQLLPDLRVITVGGRDVFTYEFVPDQGLGQFNLQFLLDTDDQWNDNLYPFVHLLPDNNLYIFANRDSILLNYYTNKVLRKYPTIPGEPRNYPCAGSSVLLPLDSANGYSIAEVLVCGGANKFAFPYPPAQPGASQTCGRMVVTSSNPTWLMQTMPMRRNMGDMVLLPNNRVLIINGAQNGSQGWMDASKPCYNPVIYDPVTSTFEVQAASTIARLYHSTANLLADGRILVAGSNTHQFYTLSGPFPTELRVEAFSPAYLDSSNNGQRPKFLKYPTIVRYGFKFSVDVAIPGKLNGGGIKLNLISAPYTTHSYSQGQRQLKLSVSTPLRKGSNSSSTYTVTSMVPSAVLAPPTYYMLFALHGGIPSTAVWVLVSF
ncbi:hypothetical protein O6H91_14G061400 [Diphasiastrum complanatum]|uniref:Uncharacterized protein n=4 Tax=Diphasiastrum complanatum TaxID=34168 RepID=A0ACC2BPZ1_DIPCM|nr:hypothetical protein O6H91_Y560100 [Diphasiastrum complanatum]KAJ7126359.1 hypothetical protein O6H91_Y560100 [Diphasiastrum complanatum]KAJ7531850.1 hypothetical protein O6H91_14G061400 [Diphasiastrum complanatum]KAJ7531851.1 hypothetical protein O6H91_14G061400 [Diphasiastrum complanatum]KAJ7531852.1 hypothetical protein O6H91_14G061400 [Diphasiastrum complanatum]